MEQRTIYSKVVKKIGKKEFTSMFLSCKPEMWFSSWELQTFSFPANVRSLAGRYLIKKTICEYIRDNEKMAEIQVVNNGHGKPEVILGKNVQRAIEQKGIKKIICSISHTRNLIAGMTVFCF
ncbi:MAG: hypothetical protein JW973_01520 [Bacteroidales bacterium]|nr:hypothetical protein [Bacteroidales bacterium]